MCLKTIATKTILVDCCLALTLIFRLVGRYCVLLINEESGERTNSQDPTSSLSPALDQASILQLAE